MKRLLTTLCAALVLLTPAASAAADEARPVSAPVVFRPIGEAILELAGRGPYRGSLEIHRNGSRLTTVNELGLEDYVNGLAEVPGHWPVEALKAQAVAARTYALWERDNGAWTKYGYDICATTSCQVYDGASMEDGERGQRWVEAVRATRGEVLLHEGRFALARYHASSGGTTLSNAHVFPKSGDRPYLRSIHDPPDKASPLHAWEVRFTHQAMTAVLREGIGLAGELDSIRPDQEARVVAVRTKGGQVELSTSRFRSVVSKHAPKLYPGTYPGKRFDGRPMPATMPSSRFEVRRDGTDFVLEGQGFGHGVGMSQWGAKGRAERGDGYREILSAYYSGLKVTRLDTEPVIRVGLTRSASSAVVSGSDAFAVLSSAQTIADSTIGRWHVSPTGSRSVLMRPPAGSDLLLVLSGLNAPTSLVVTDGVLDRPLQVDFVLPKSARIEARLVLDGRTIAEAGEVYEPGEGRLRVEVPEPGQLPGRAAYALVVEAFDGRTRATGTLEVDIVRPESGTGLRAALVLAVVAGAVLLVLRRGRRPGPPGPERVDRAPAGPGASPAGSRLEPDRLR